MKKQIAYKSGYNYQLVEDYQIIIPIKPRVVIETPYISLTPEGLLTIKAGYAWDGATDAFDTITFMRGSMVHDALYGLMRAGYFDPSEYRIVADKILMAICLEDGMWGVKAKLVYLTVRKFAEKAAMGDGENPIIRAP